MDQYRLNDKTYSFSYKALKTQFEKYEQLSDAKFLADLPNILHFTVFVCWFKQLKTEDLLSDIGLVHELVHLLCLKDYGVGGPELDDPEHSTINSIRKLFNDTCRLV